MCNNETDVDRIIGSCNQKTGLRSVTYKLKPNAQCVILPGQPGVDGDKTYITSELTHITESCSVVGDIQENEGFMFVAQVIGTTFALVMFVLMIVCLKYRRLRVQYELIAGPEQTEDP